MSTKSSYFLLLYQVAPNYLEARVPHRKEHLILAQEYADKGHLVLGGALNNPADGAVLVFYASDSSIIEEFVKRDPYVKAGAVTGWTIRNWTVVVGSRCENPIRLSDL